LSDTQDLVQVTLVRVLSHLEGFEHSGGGSLLGYLQQALLNVLRNEIRRSRRRGEHGELPEELAADEAESPLAHAAGRKASSATSALAQLTGNQQELIVMRMELALTTTRWRGTGQHARCRAHGVAAGRARLVGG
jgi:DNA-directed RNA polymerase specialized sigma24 family protein